jgi:hypothetical protein
VHRDERDDAAGGVSEDVLNAPAVPARTDTLADLETVPSDLDLGTDRLHVLRRRFFAVVLVIAYGWT